MNKLGPRFVGPFIVKRKINNVSYELTLPDSLKIHPVFNLSLLKPMTPDPFPDHNAGPPEPVIIDGEEEYKVETILDCRRRLINCNTWLSGRGIGQKNIHGNQIPTYMLKIYFKLSFAGILKSWPSWASGGCL